MEKISSKLGLPPTLLSQKRVYEETKSRIVWNIRRLVIDKTGLGEGLAALLTQRFGEERVVAFRVYEAHKVTPHVPTALTDQLRTVEDVPGG